MRLQRTTWILVVIALALGGFVYIYEIQGKEQRETTEARKQIFDFEEEDIQGLTIVQPEQTLRFERTDSDLPWQMKQPKDIPASDAAVSFLLNLLVEGESDRTFTIAPEQKSEYGLEKPFAEIEVELKDSRRELILGNPNFDNKFVYAQVDSSSQADEDLAVILVPIDFQYAVERELEEWQQ